MKRLAVLLQQLLPQHLLSRAVFRLSRWPGPLARPLMRAFARHYQVALDEAALPGFDHYPHFNAFFTRALRPGARPLAAGERLISAPCDGRFSQLGAITGGRILQAKGQDFSAAELLGDAALAAEFDGGAFATIYLSPRDYHRIHMPLDGRLLGTLHIPGRLFSVAPAAVEGVPRLFARNERVVCWFETPAGPMAQVLVGALNVAAIETVWAGLITPPAGWGLRRIAHRGEVALARGAEMGRFNMGSTVLLLLPAGVSWAPELAPGQAVQMGCAIGRY